MTPQYILRKSLCREPHCAGPHEFRGIKMKHWPKGAHEEYIRRANSEIDNLEFAKEYAEPGYTQPKKGILFANWNYFSRDVSDLLEKYGFECEWSDEWTTCDNCYNALRTNPDCYQWQPSYITTKAGGDICLKCLKTDEALASEYLEGLENNHRRAVNLEGFDLASLGYRELQCGYESGWHKGMDADPKKIFEEFKAHGHKRLLFQIYEQSQFYITFCIWEKVEEPKETNDNNDDDEWFNAGGAWHHDKYNPL